MAVAQRIYAEALLEAAREKNALEDVRDEFDAFTAAVAASSELEELLRNPQIDPEARRAALDAVLTSAAEPFRNFVLLLTEKGRIGELQEIHAEWTRLLAAAERVLELELTTAVELSEGDAAEIVGRIERAAGRRVEASRHVDPELIGGLVLQAGSLRVDGSVRGRLQTLRTELLAAG
ncbi:MAG: ATP synthase F1 subunit delta [Thermoleophilia bacterium]|nr:ATP synthase F1 subunit delta [Thermoleophilia bacterium]